MWGVIAEVAYTAFAHPENAAAYHRQETAFLRAERMNRKRLLRRAMPLLAVAGVALGLWAGYHALMWMLWWEPHPIVFMQAAYP